MNQALKALIKSLSVDNDLGVIISSQEELEEIRRIKGIKKVYWEYSPGLSEVYYLFDDSHSNLDYALKNHKTISFKDFLAICNETCSKNALIFN